MKKKWIVLSPWCGTEVAQAFASLEKIEALCGEQVSYDKQSTVIKAAVAGRFFYVKRYHKPAGLRSWVGRARIRLEARNQLWFNEIGLPSAQVVAYGEHCRLGRTLRGALVTEEVVGTRDLAWMAQHKPALVNDADWTNAVIEQLAEITRVLHAHRFCHNDLKWRNILVTQDTQKPQVFLIDCPAGQRWPRLLLQRRIIKDLACLDKVAKYHLSRSRRLRFYLKYRETRKLNREDKEMIQKVLAFFRGRE